jgi:hypothetical protein
VAGTSPVPVTIFDRFVGAGYSARTDDVYIERESPRIKKQFNEIFQ